MTAYWLVKSEPDAFSWKRQVEDGVSRWDGVRNHQAAANLRAMRLGDLVFFYHSNIGKEIVGVVRVHREAYPDPTDPTGRFVAVDLSTVGPMPSPVGLKAIKGEASLSELPLLRQSRLSVVPIPPTAWRMICRMGGWLG